MVVGILFTVALILTIVLPVCYYISGEKSKGRFKKSLAANILGFFGIFLMGTIIMFSTTASAAEVSGDALANGIGMFSAGLAIGLACIASGYAVASSASAALGALSEDQSVFGKALIFVALAEGIALWGFIVAFLILTHVA